ncbi:unnamed protein product [Polarella glacialis]|uniref:RING-type domain-containing protein n=1 Tax=Polarella glacialis TaxID=89957 RepID=A0A813FG81_POLGL|nr:unnamed protein product [Polarella glacialis]
MARIQAPEAVFETCRKCRTPGSAQKERWTKAMECSKCPAYYCQDCGGHWHDEHNCAGGRWGKGSKQVKEHIQRVLAKADHHQYIRKDLGEGTKPCPGCERPCYKDGDGCEHMVCTQCEMEFCWICSGDRRVIKAHDNSHHFPKFNFFMASSCPPEYKPDHCYKCSETGKPCMTPQWKQQNQHIIYGYPKGGHGVDAIRQERAYLAQEAADAAAAQSAWPTSWADCRRLAGI